MDAQGDERLTAFVGEQNDRTLSELAARYHARCDVGRSRSVLSRSLRPRGLGAGARLHVDRGRS